MKTDARGSVRTVTAHDALHAERIRDAIHGYGFVARIAYMIDENVWIVISPDACVTHMKKSASKTANKISFSR